MVYKQITGNLITLAKEGKFDIITHGVNCFCTMGAGIAPQMAKEFGCNEFPLERIKRGDPDKLGRIDYQLITPQNQQNFPPISFYVINSYTQYNYGRNHKDGNQTPIDYEALTLCMRKINKIFPGKHIGLPKIGAGLAGGDWSRIKGIIMKELKDMQVTVVNYDGS